MSLWDWLRENFFPQPTLERPSPKIRITPEQADQLIKAIVKIPGYEHCFVGAIAPTNSMEPGIDDGFYVVLDTGTQDFVVGDIVWFEHPAFQAIHRIVEIGMDTEPYFRTKGDNNSKVDPIKVRPEHIKGVWRMTLD